METGVMFTNSTVVNESAPSSMENIIHIKDDGAVVEYMSIRLPSQMKMMKNTRCMHPLSL
jgi:hypothetical protein